MQENTIIQKNLFAIGNDNDKQKEITKIPEDFIFRRFKKRIAKKTQTKKKFN